MKYTEGFISELVSASRIRGAIYVYFYNVFKAPANESFLGLTGAILPYFKEFSLITGNENVKKAVSGLEAYAEEEKNLKNKKDFLNSLNINFTGLFLLGINGVPVNASVYLSPDGLLKGRAWEKVCLVYEKRGFVIPEDFKEPEDHIAIESLYMGKLNDLLLKLINENLTDKIKTILTEQKTFIDCHMLPWVKNFAAQTREKGTGKPLYGSCATLLAEFLEYDSALTEELIADA